MSDRYRGLPVGHAKSTTDADATRRAAIFKSSRNGQYWWVAKGENHETLCSSELMATKQSCINGIRVVKDGATNANVYDETGERSGDVAARRIAV
jgi:uncharacterized protein YegP (UPF0339 family)